MVAGGLQPSAAFGVADGTNFQSPIVAPWGVVETSVAAGQVAHLAPRGTGLPPGWVWHGMAQIHTDPLDAARMLYVKNGRAQWTSRIGRASLVAGGDPSHLVDHGRLARASGLIGVRGMTAARGSVLIAAADPTTVGKGVIAELVAPGMMMVWAGGGTSTSLANIHGRSAKLAGPRAAVYRELVDGVHVVFSEEIGNRLRQVNEAGMIEHLAGTGVAGYGGDGGDAKLATFRGPTGLASAADGTLYVADSGNHAIRAIDTNGVVTTIAGHGSATGALGDGGDATMATEPC